MPAIYQRGNVILRMRNRPRSSSLSARHQTEQVCDGPIFRGMLPVLIFWTWYCACQTHGQTRSATDDFVDARQG